MITINNKKYLIIILSLLILILASNLTIQAKDNNYIEGIKAYYNNPALMKADNNIEINIYGQAAVANNAINIKYLNQHIDESKKTEILDNIGKNELILTGQGQQGFDIRYKNFTFFTGLSESGLVAIPKDAIEIVLKGNEIGREYSLDGAVGAGTLYLDSGLNYSHSINKLKEQFKAEEVSIGATLHYLQGGIAHIKGDGSFIIDYEDAISGSGNLKVEYAEVAAGYALGFGINTKVNEKLAWGASISNIGKLTADKSRYFEYSYDPVEEEFTETPEQPGGKLEYTLPLKFKLGTKYKWKDNTNLIGGYSLTNYSNGYSNHKISGGVEYNRFKFLPVSFGVTYSSLQGSMILSSGAALKLGPMYAKVTFSDLQALFNGSKSISFGISTGFSF